MSRISETIDVDVPVRVAYDQWTQFESFPEFMDGVERVDQVDDVTVDWTASIAGRTKQWRAKITDQEPDTLIAWQSTSGARNDGRVEFESLGADRTRIVLELDVEPEGAIESAGNALGLVEGRVKGDLERFKTFIEGRKVATGAWRGEVRGGQETKSASGAPVGTTDSGGSAGGGGSAGSGGTTGSGGLA